MGTFLRTGKSRMGALASAGAKQAFFAMVQLNNVEFHTGLPDGNYCDPIHECKQTITISGGKARFDKAEPNYAVVAICVGCKND